MVRNAKQKPNLRCFNMIGEFYTRDLYLCICQHRVTELTEMPLSRSLECTKGWRYEWTIVDVCCNEDDKLNISNIDSFSELQEVCVVSTFSSPFLCRNNYDISRLDGIIFMSLILCLNSEVLRFYIHFKHKGAYHFLNYVSFLYGEGVKDYLRIFIFLR